jgi:hypothetical protein
VCSDAKPINELTMVWNGTQAVRIRAWKGSVGSTLLAEINNIQPNQEVTVTGYAGAPNDVIWEVFTAGSTGTNGRIGQSTFHLSCSDSNMNGPEDCRLPQGDGKDKTGFLNLWLFEGMAGNGQRLDCTTTPPTPSDQCQLTLGPVPSCESVGKPTSLTFRYTGGNCQSSNNPQGGKATCTGSINPALAIQVSSSGKDAPTISPSTVNPNQEFTVSASKFGADTRLSLSNAGGTESLSIHTSCSQVLAVGNVFGNLTLVAFNGQRGGGEVTYGYTVANNGDALTNVSVVDNRLGAIAGPFNLGAGQTQQFSRVANINQTTTNTVNVSGQLSNGVPCQASDSATVTVQGPPVGPQACTKPIQAMLLRYTGPSVASARVEFDPDKGPTVVYNNVMLVSGATILSLPTENNFTIDAQPDENELGAKTKIRINGVEEVIHTSCSTPFVAGAPAPLDNPKGAPSPNWFVESFRQRQ